jgi:hypothetical protein
MSAEFGPAPAGRTGNEPDTEDTAQHDRSQAGWTTAAIAVHSILQLPFPMYLRLQPDDEGAILVDFGAHAYSWARPVAELPTRPREVLVETEQADGGGALFAGEGHDLDELLWAVGVAAFDGSAASWLRPGDRYRLSRWPDFGRMGHSPEQLRMTAVLANVAVSAAELALAAGVGREEAQRLLNALTLMRAAHAASEARPAAEPTPAPGPVAHPGLFARLRARLGL